MGVRLELRKAPKTSPKVISSPPEVLHVLHKTPFGMPNGDIVLFFLTSLPKEECLHQPFQPRKHQLDNWASQIG